MKKIHIIIFIHNKYLIYSTPINFSDLTRNRVHLQIDIQEKCNKKKVKKAIEAFAVRERRGERATERGRRKGGEREREREMCARSRSMVPHTGDDLSSSRDIATPCLRSSA